MAGYQNIRFPAFHIVESILQASFIGVNQMHASDDSVNPVDTGYLFDIFHRIDETGMTAAQKDQQTFVGFEPHGLVIFNQIIDAPMVVKEKRAARIFQ